MSESKAASNLKLHYTLKRFLPVNIEFFVNIGKGLLLWQCGLIANVKLHFLLFLELTGSCQQTLTSPVHTTGKWACQILSSCVVNIHLTLTGRDLRCDFWCILHQEVHGLGSTNFTKGLLTARTAFKNPKRSILDRKIFNHWWAMHSLAFNGYFHLNFFYSIGLWSRSSMLEINLTCSSKL